MGWLLGYGGDPELSSAAALKRREIPDYYRMKF
jgi:hypothetical protein